MAHIASFSGGKDSTAMVLRLIDESWPLDEVVFYDTGMEFDAVYDVVGKIEALCRNHGIRFTRLFPKKPFLDTMLLRPVKSGKIGYGWCGRMCRWGTFAKNDAIGKHIRQYDECYEYIGIAADEGGRIKDKVYPLVEWGMTEEDCLRYCYDRGYDWNQNGVRLYDILDRCSCWCCWNKNKKELYNMYRYLPDYWKRMLRLQEIIDRPFRGDNSLFDFDSEFKERDNND